MKCLCPNELNNLVIVERVKPSASVDGSGNVDESLDTNWGECGRAWTQVITKGSREFFRNQQVGQDITHQFTMRWTKKAGDYTTGMRFRMDGRKFHIKAPPMNVDENNRWLVFQTTEVPVL